MNEVPPASPRRNAVARAIAFLIDAWRAATARHFAYTALLGLVWTGVILATTRNAYVTSWGPYLNATLTMQFNGFAVLLAVLLADQASPPPLRRWWLYVSAVAVGSAIGSSILWAFSIRLLGASTAYGSGQWRPEPFETFFYRHATHGFVIWGMTTFVYVRQRWAAHSVAALRALQLDRARIEKRVHESQLTAMQARVDPEFLRSTLSEIERLYEVDAPAGDRLLNELIFYLRAAMPNSHEPGSTVAREIQLANAYLSIVGLRSKEWLVVDGEGRAIAASARIPPMVMLPLINHALAQRIDRSLGDERFAIDLRIRGEMLVAAIRDEGRGFSPAAAADSGIARIRERLAAILGANAKLTLVETAAGTEARLEIPYDAATACLSGTAEMSS